MEDAASQNAVAVATKPASRRTPKTDRPWLWNVVLLDDQQHTYEYVMKLMNDVFGFDDAHAFRIAHMVDTRGRATCQTTHRELAELRVQQVRGFGADPLIASSKVGMRAFIEPAEQGEDA
ncbi:MAG: ATP-dependent Clp protease adaptor ClpS [Planctomycetota bacterium]